MFRKISAESPFDSNKNEERDDSSQGSDDDSTNRLNNPKKVSNGNKHDEPDDAWSRQGAVIINLKQIIDEWTPE